MRRKVWPVIVPFAALAIFLVEIFPAGIGALLVLLSLMALVVIFRLLGVSGWQLILAALLVGVAWAGAEFATYELGIGGRSISEYEQRLESPWEYRLLMTTAFLAFAAVMASMLSLCIVELGRRAFPD